MSTHEGVSCDACQKSDFKGKRFKCLHCFDYDLCADCYEHQASTGMHLPTHPMQCLLTLSDIPIFYSEESVRKQSWSFTCPICGLKGFTEESLISHANEKHLNDYTEVICPICATVPGFEPNQMVDYFVNHMNSSIHQACDENTAVRIRQRIRGTSSNRARRSQFSSNVNNAAGGGPPAPRDNQIGSVAQFLTQFSDSRFIRSYAPGQQIISSAPPRHQGSSNSDRFMAPKWGQMRMEDSAWDGRKNESPTARALYKKDDTPWLRNPPPNLIEEPSAEVSVFEMDRSAFVIQLLLSTLSIEVPLHGTDPVPRRQLFDDSESDMIGDQTRSSDVKKSQKLPGASDKFKPTVPKSTEQKAKLKGNDKRSLIGDNFMEKLDEHDDDDEEEEESGEELSDKDDSDDDEDAENSDARTIQNDNCDGLKRPTHRNNTNKQASKPYLRLNSAPPTSGSGTPAGQRSTMSGHTTKPLLPTSSGNVSAASQARASKVRSASLNSGSSISSLASSMRSTLGPMTQSGAISVVSPTGRRRTFAPGAGNIGSVGAGSDRGGGGGVGGGGGGGHAQRQQHPDSSAN